MVRFVPLFGSLASQSQPADVLRLQMRIGKLSGTVVCFQALCGVGSSCSLMMLGCDACDDYNRKSVECEGRRRMPQKCGLQWCMRTWALLKLSNSRCDRAQAM